MQAIDELGKKKSRYDSTCARKYYEVHSQFATLNSKSCDLVSISICIQFQSCADVFRLTMESALIGAVAYSVHIKWTCAFDDHLFDRLRAVLLTKKNSLEWIRQMLSFFFSPLHNYAPWKTKHSVLFIVFAIICCCVSFFCLSSFSKTKHRETIFIYRLSYVIVVLIQHCNAIDV